MHEPRNVRGEVCSLSSIPYTRGLASLVAFGLINKPQVEVAPLEIVFFK